ncbi:E3 ubiquitin-protein ligase UHRF2-like isoform X2 [Trichomycterus rosablanca]|uniref:E3 ubiquitin-protein ligase UHRF2-like isoform X2 n=1 Tax=Trichomycterus rosablanca TaxID=2290929 RepID=UPI002F35B6E0
MWIQVRTIDGQETRTVEDLSRLTKIESLRVKIQKIFNVDPGRQRLFYRGKQMEDGQTLFDYNVGLNDIVQLLIRSHTDPPDSPSPAPNNEEAVVINITPPSSTPATPTTTTPSPKTVITKNESVSDSQPSTSSSTDLVDPGIGVYKVNELVDCRDLSIGAWFEATVKKVAQFTKAPRGRPRKKHINGKVETEAEPDTNGTAAVSTDSGEPSTSQTESTAHNKDKVVYHIKYEDYPENGVVELSAGDVRPRARTLLRFEQLEVGQVVMVSYNLEIPEERGFWYDAEITALNDVSRTKKEVRVKILLGGPDDVIGDCKLIFLDEIYRIEKPGAPPLSITDGQFKRKSGPECKHCKGDPDAECRFCSCCVCGGKQDAHMQLLCDECNMAFHLYCLNPPLSTIPEDEDWYCPTCKNDTSEVVKAGERLKESKKRAKMPSAVNGSSRDWGKGMACVGRTKECTIVPSNHYGPIPGIPVGTTWKFRVQVSEAGVHRPHVGGIHGRSNDGSYSLVLAGGFEDEVVVKYWPEIGKCGFLVWRYLLRRDDMEPAPWTPEGIERSKKLGLKIQYPPGYLEAMANKSKKEVSVRGGRGGATRGKRRAGTERSRTGRPPKGVKEEEEDDGEEEEAAAKEDAEMQSNEEEETQEDTVCDEEEEEAEPKVKRLKEAEAFVLSDQQQSLIQQDQVNKKVWDEALRFLVEGPNFLRKVEQSFMCVCCQELSYQPVTTPCQHNVCKTCLHRSFKAEVYTCPACRYDLGKDYVMVLNKTLQLLLDQFFPGYSKGR